MDKTVRYGRIGEVVVMIFPDEDGSKDFVRRIETQNLLSQMTNKNVPVAPLKSIIGRPLTPRVAA